MNSEQNILFVPMIPVDATYTETEPCNRLCKLHVCVCLNSFLVSTGTFFWLPKECTVLQLYVGTDIRCWHIVVTSDEF